MAVEIAREIDFVTDFSLGDVNPGFRVDMRQYFGGEVFLPVGANSD